MRLFVLLGLITLLGACGPRPTIVVNQRAQDVGEIRPIFFFTTRAQDETGRFTGGRSFDTTYGKINVSIPPLHRPGKLELRAENPDPARHFVAQSRDIFDNAGAMRARLRDALARQKPGEREVVLFVHGFNTTLGEGIYRQAQLMHDFELPNVGVSYSWPAYGHPLGYNHDRDSALFARDGLEETIRTLTGLGAESVIIVAHSLGSQLTMETLRQIAISGSSSVMSAIGGVVLLAPDIDVDLFKAQALRIGKLPQPFVVIGSKRDRALLLSARINGSGNRLGNLANADDISDLELTFVDVSSFSRRRELGHFTIGTSPALIKVLQNLPAMSDTFQSDPTKAAGLIPGTILTVQNATEVILRPVTGRPQ